MIAKLKLLLDYSCLRSYSNQQRHDVLVRGLAQGALGTLLGRDPGTVWDDKDAATTSMEGKR